MFTQRDWRFLNSLHLNNESRGTISLKISRLFGVSVAVPIDERIVFHLCSFESLHFMKCGFRILTITSCLIVSWNGGTIHIRYLLTQRPFPGSDPMFNVCSFALSFFLRGNSSSTPGLFSASRVVPDSYRLKPPVLHHTHPNRRRALLRCAGGSRILLLLLVFAVLRSELLTPFIVFSTADDLYHSAVYYVPLLLAPQHLGDGVNGRHGPPESNSRFLCAPTRGTRSFALPCELFRNLTRLQKRLFSFWISDRWTSLSSCIRDCLVTAFSYTMNIMCALISIENTAGS